MAKIKIEEVVQHLDYGMKRALEAAVEETIRDAKFDRQTLFKAFVKHVGRKCDTWEVVPDNYIDK